MRIYNAGSYNFFIFNIFFNLKFFYGFIFKLLSSDQKNDMNKLHMKKMPKFEKDGQKKLLDGCSTTLEFFLVKHIYIFVLVN